MAAAATAYRRVPEVAERLTVSYGTVLGLIRSGQLKAHRVGRLILVSDTAVEQYLDAATIQPADPEATASTPRSNWRARWKS